MNLAERIQLARNEAGFSQKQLAELVGSSKRSIAHWEGGYRQPEFTFIVRIADATGKPVDFFAGAVRLTEGAPC